MNGVLKQAGIVAHRQEMADAHFRRGRAGERGAPVSARAIALSRCPRRALSKTDYVALGGAFPCHRAAAA